MADATQQKPAAAPARFRQAHPEDVYEIAGWIRSRRDCELWAGPWLPYPLDAELLPADIDLYGADSIAMVEKDRLVAFGQLMYVDTQRSHLARIIVAPNERGRGRGRALIGELIRRAREQGYACISLYVNRANPAALALYRRFGFRRAPRPPGEQASSDSVYMLCRPDRLPTEPD